MRHAERDKAIRLRRQGKTYSEILAVVPVAKSTLSEWFRSVALSSPQIQRLTKKRLLAGKRGGEARRLQRLSEVERQRESGVNEVGGLSKRDLWLIGIALYWAEGSKQYEHSPSTGLTFNNSDSRMLLVYLRWLRQLGIPSSAIIFELYVHKARASEVAEYKRWWARELSLNVRQLDRTYLKQGNPKTRRRNTADLYHGLIRIKVKSSTNLNRKISGWVHGIVASLGDRLMVGHGTLNPSI